MRSWFVEIASNRKMMALVAGLLCLTVQLVSVPDQAEATLCCEPSYSFDYSFYADPGRTQLVGGCVAECGHTSQCWGEMTQYFTYWDDPCTYCWEE